MINKTKLPNGLLVVTDTNKNVQTVVAAVGIHTGNRNETSSEIGLSHALEHMLFKGTKKRNYEELNDAIESVGSYMNAFTSNDKTVYYVKGLKENFEIGLDVLSDQVLNSTFPDTEVKKEMEVIVQEIKRSDDDPSDMMSNNFMRLAFTGTPLENPILGSREQVLSYTPAHMRAYHKKHYHPKNMILSVAGNIDHKKVVKLAKKYFKTENVPFKREDIHPVKWNSGECLIHAESEQQVNIMIGWGTSGYDANSKELATLALLNCILGVGMGSMLFNEIREKRGLSYSVGSYVNHYEEVGFLGIYGGTDSDKLNSFIECTAQVMREFNKKVSDKDLKKAKNMVKTMLCTGNESIENSAMDNIAQIQKFGKVRSVEKSLKLIDSIKIEDIKKAMTKLLKVEPTLSIYGYAPQLISTKLEKSKRINLENFQNLLKVK